MASMTAATSASICLSTRTSSSTFAAGWIPQPRSTHRFDQTAGVPLTARGFPPGDRAARRGLKHVSTGLTIFIKREAITMSLLTDLLTNLFTVRSDPLLVRLLIFILSMFAAALHAVSFWKR